MKWRISSWEVAESSTISFLCVEFELVFLLLTTILNGIRLLKTERHAKLNGIGIPFENHLWIQSINIENGIFVPTKFELTMLLVLLCLWNGSLYELLLLFSKSVCAIARLLLFSFFLCLFLLLFFFCICFLPRLLRLFFLLNFRFNAKWIFKSIFKWLIPNRTTSVNE